MTHSSHQNTPDPEDYIPSFRRRNLDTSGFMKKLKRAKMIIVGALVYFLSPIDSIPDLLIPFGFSDDIAVIALVYSQMKNYLTEDIQEKARQAADKLFGS